MFLPCSLSPNQGALANTSNSPAAEVRIALDAFNQGWFNRLTYGDSLQFHDSPSAAAEDEPSYCGIHRSFPNWIAIITSSLDYLGYDKPLIIR